MACRFVLVASLLVTAVAGDTQASVEAAAAPYSLRGAEARQLQAFGATDDQDGQSSLTYHAKSSSHVSWVSLVIYIIFAIIYKMKVVDAYPKFDRANEESKELQNENEVTAFFNSCCHTNCLLSWFCVPARAAHTFEATGVLSYWCGVVLMIFFPFCTLCFTNSCTDMNEKLGGEKRNCIMSMFCTWCCLPCVVLQDAASLDAATGAETGCCSVEMTDSGSLSGSGSQSE